MTAFRIVIIALIATCFVAELKSLRAQEHSVTKSDALASIIKNEAPTKKNILKVQDLLRELGFDPGALDGLLGPNTKHALREWRDSDSRSVTIEKWIGQYQSGSTSSIMTESVRQTGPGTYAVHRTARPGKGCVGRRHGNDIRIVCE